LVGVREQQRDAVEPAERLIGLVEEGLGIKVSRASLNKAPRYPDNLEQRLARCGAVPRRAARSPRRTARSAAGGARAPPPRPPGEGGQASPGHRASSQAAGLQAMQRPVYRQ